MTILLAGGTLSVVNNVGLESYLSGVVPWEMPARWSPEALKVQAVAARSYALASRKPTGSYDLFDDTRSQVYGGVVAEDPRTNVAISDTAAEIRTYDGVVAWTFFHSTSGGRTAAMQDVWAGAAPKPYLVSVPDPYDSISPYHNWGPFRYSRAALDTELGSSVSGRLLDLKTTVNASRRVDEVLAKGTTGPTSISASTFKVALGLRSTWFRIGVMDLKTAQRQVRSWQSDEADRSCAQGRQGLARAKARGWRVDALPGSDAGCRRDVRHARSASSCHGLQGRVEAGEGRRGTRARDRPGELLQAHRLFPARGDRPAEPAARVRRDPAQVGERVGLTVAEGRTTASGEFSIRVALRPGSTVDSPRSAPGSTLGRTPLLHVVSE